jgi:hypothetical protein
VGEVKLLVLPWICLPPLSSRDRQGSVVGVVMLIDFTSSSNNPGEYLRLLTPQITTSPRRVSYGPLGDRADVGFLGLFIGYSMREIICPQKLSTILYDLSNTLVLKPVNVQ